MDIPTVTQFLETLTAFSIHWTTSYVRYVDATEQIWSDKLNMLIARMKAYHGRSLAV